jgi:hypothetical protein
MLDDLISEWQKTSKHLKEVKQKEWKLRKEICETILPNVLDKKGVHSAPLKNGRGVIMIIKKQKGKICRPILVCK